MRRLFFLLIGLLFCSGCKTKILSAYTDYVTIESLASYHVNTPDPTLENPPFEQRLIISWVIPSYLRLENATLFFTVRLRNREEIQQVISINKRQGSTLFRLGREEFMETGGILTYKAALENEGALLAEWKHLLWKELIHVPLE